jgi:hypothetical protein
MKILGEAVVQQICPSNELDIPLNQRKANWFRKDHINPITRRGELVTSSGDIEANQSHLSNPEWVDSRNTK